MFEMKNWKSRVALPTYRAGLLQAQAYRALTAFMTQTLGVYGITMSEWALLGLLHEQTSARPSELAQQLGVKPPVVTSMVSQLVAKDWIVKTADVHDNRVVNLDLTEQGTAAIVTIERTVRAEFRTFMSDISLLDLAAYVRVLDKLAKKL